MWCGFDCFEVRFVRGGVRVLKMLRAGVGWRGLARLLVEKISRLGMLDICVCV